MKTDPNETFGGWLKQRRKALDLTQAELANQVGCAEVTIRKIESGTTRPSKQLTERLADAVLISAEERASFTTFARRSTETLPMLPASEAVHHLPTHMMPLVGRTAELAQISQRLTNADCRLLTLIGPGGIGKTRLALEAASQQTSNFAQGVFFIALAPVASPDLLVPTIINTLKIPAYGTAEPRAQIVTYFNNRQTLLVIDNCEHLLPGIDLLADILRNAPNVKILATSRERLNLQEEWNLPIEGLAYPAEKDEQAIDNFSAVQLFAARAVRVRPDFTLADNLDAVIDICRAVEGMPLGIELAASGLRVMSCAQIAAQINGDLDFLTTPVRNVPERHRSLRAVFDHSWELLSEAEQRVLATLSVFRGGFDLDAAAKVAGASLTLLASLVDKSLVRLQPSGRYNLHEQLRQYAALKLTDEQTAKRRHFDYFLSLAEQAEMLLVGGPSQIAWLDRFEDEEHNLRSALTWTLDGDEHELGLQLAGLIGPFWRGRYRYREGYQWLMNALSKNPKAPALLRCKAYLHACHLARHYPGNISHAISLGEQALAMAYKAEHQEAIAYSLADLGYVLALDQGQRQRGIQLLEESISMFREMHNPGGLIEGLEGLGMALTASGECERAIRAQEEGLTLAREFQYQFMVGWLLLGLGWSTAFVGKLDRANFYSRECLDMFHIANEPKGRAFAILLHGDLSYLNGNYAEAQTYYIDSLIRLKEMGFDWDIARLLDRLVVLASAQHCPTQAATLLGAVTAYNQAVGRSNFDSPPVFTPAPTVIRDQLGDPAFNFAYEEGRRLTIQQATAYALQAFAG